jgi:hypothetical protein
VGVDSNEKGPFVGSFADIHPLRWERSGGSRSQSPARRGTEQGVSIAHTKRRTREIGGQKAGHRLRRNARESVGRSKARAVRAGGQTTIGSSAPRGLRRHRVRHIQCKCFGRRMGNNSGRNHQLRRGRRADSPGERLRRNARARRWSSTRQPQQLGVSNVEELKRQLVTFWVINRRRDSLERCEGVRPKLCHTRRSRHAKRALR